MKRLLLIFSSLLFILFITIMLFISTEFGLKFTVIIAKKLVPGNLQITQIHGRLIGPLSIGSIKYQGDDQITIEQFQFDKINHLSLEKFFYYSKNLSIQTYHTTIDWQLKQIFHRERQLLIKQLIANQLIINVPISKKSDKKINQFADVQLPMATNIDHIQVNTIQIKQDTNLPMITTKNFQGKIHLHPDQSIIANITWQSLWYDSKNLGPIESQSGSFHISGHSQNFMVRLDSQLLLPHRPRGTITVHGQGNLNRIALKTFHLQFGNDDIQCQAILGWKPLNIDVTAINAHISQQHFTGKIQLKTDKNQSLQINTNLRSQDNILSIHGEIGQKLNVDWQIAINDLSQMIPSFTGKLHSKGILTGTWGTLQLKGYLNANHLTILQQKAKAITAKFTMQQDLTLASSIELDGENISNDHITIDKLHFRASNHQHQQKLHAQLLLSQQLPLSATLDISGKLYHQNWQGQLDQLSLQQQTLSMHLEKPSKITINPHKIMLDSSCFIVNKQSLCIKGNLNKSKQWAIKGSSQALELTAITKLFKQNLDMVGSLKLAIDASGTGQKIHQLTLQSYLNKTLVKFTVNHHLQQLTIHHGKLDLKLDKQGLNSLLALSLPHSQPLTVALTMPKFLQSSKNIMAQKITAAIHYQTDHLEFLDLLLPNITALTGQIFANITVHGTLKNPKIQGQLQLNKGECHIPNLGLHLKNIYIAAKANDKNTITYHSNMISGKGKIRIAGKTSLNQPHVSSQTTIRGENFDVMNINDFHITASPKITINSHGNIVKAQGTILIPIAKISPVHLDNTVSLSSDVVFANDLAQAPPALQIDSQIHMILGKDISVDYKGLSAKLNGEILVSDKPDKPTTGVGQINIVKGIYKAYGAKLNIRPKSHLSFTGSKITNPGLNIEAVHEFQTTSVIDNSNNDENTTRQAIAEDQVVGLRVLGTVDDPQITLFSEPGGLTQQEMLSYLVFGHMVSSNSGFDPTLLLRGLSILDLGQTQTSLAKNQLQHSIGLDQVEINSSQQYSSEEGRVVDNTSLVLGKALSPKLFINYSIGLIEPINIMSLQYKLRKNFSVRTESSVNAQGIDIFYTYSKP